MFGDNLKSSGTFLQNLGKQSFIMKKTEMKLQIEK
jgi:hypothetical protein